MTSTTGTSDQLHQQWAHFVSFDQSHIQPLAKLAQELIDSAQIPWHDPCDKEATNILDDLRALSDQHQALYEALSHSYLQEKDGDGDGDGAEQFLDRLHTLFAPIKVRAGELERALDKLREVVRMVKAPVDGAGFGTDYGWALLVGCGVLVCVTAVGWRMYARVR